MVNNLAMRECVENDIARHAASAKYSEEELMAAPAEAKIRASLTRLDDRVDARFTPGEETIDELIRRELSAEQLHAAEMILSGATDSTVTRAVKVHRCTVARWRLFHPAFVAEVNRRRHSELQGIADRVRRLAVAAIGVLERQIADNGNPDTQTRAALALLRMAGAHSAARRTGHTSTEEMIDTLAIARRKRKNYSGIDHGERYDVLMDLACRAEHALVESEAR